MNKEYLTVKEFATAVNITPQAVYQKLNKDLKPFLKLEKGKKTIHCKALELFKEKETVKQVDEDLINTLTSTLKVLEEQLKAKDNQIDALTQALHQEQALHLQTQQKVLMLEESAGTEKKKKWKFW